MRLRILVVLACLLLTAAVGWGQEARGTVVGSVTDPSGAAIPGAPVTVTNKNMGTKVVVSTNEAGLYQAAYLIPGVYTVSVEFQGFKKYFQDGVEVRVNDRLEVNVKLEIGAPDQTVTVTGETPLLNTASASMGTVVDGRRIAEMPIPHGNPYFLIGLAAGVSFTRDPRLDRPFEPTHIVGYSMDGTRANRSDVTFDGAVSTSTANAGEVTSSYVPPADIIAEFKVQTATFDASFGQTEGGVTNISMKSGTNTPHGTAYWTKMPKKLFANDFFANRNNVPLPDFYYDRWGGSAGGPVYIPKLYDGRNRTFVMWGYEGIHEGRPRNNGNPTVPTTAMKQGDFSALLNVSPNYQVYNPFTRRAIAGGRFQADPFPGNRIPASMINPISANILKFFPEPRSAGNPDGSNNFQRPELLEEAKYYTHSVRVDHNISDKNRLFVRGSVYRRDSTYNNFFDNLSTGSLFQFLSRAGVIDDVHTISPSTVLNVRYGYNRFIRVDRANAESNGFDLTSLGFPASYNNAISPDARNFPRIEMSGYQGTGFGADFRPTDTHSFNATLQKSQGSHFLKGGMEFRAYRENSRPTANTQTGQFNFNADWTKGPLDNAPTAPNQYGQSVAAMLLGLPATSSFVSRPASYAEQSLSWGFFLHDDWKVSRKLTVNLGLRWEFEGALKERHNRSVAGFDFTTPQPFDAAARTRYAANPTPEVAAASFVSRGGLLFATPSSRGLYNTPKRNLMPRIGLAYQLNDKTVIRSGYGIFFGFLGQRRGDVILSGFSQNTPIANASPDGVNFTPVLNNPFPNGLLDPIGSGAGLQTFVGQSITFFDQNPVMPYMQRWQFGIQRDLGKGFVLESSYVGNRGNRVEIGQNLNVTPQQFLSTSPTRDNTRIAYLSANLPNPYQGILPAGATGTFTGANLSRERLLRPYPFFDAVNHARFDGYSWYHSLQLQMEKRFSKGFTLNGSYTFSKYMQASEVLNQDDLRPVEVISDLDRPHRIVFSGLYELPFGKGRPFLSSLNPVAARIVGGWQVAGVYTWQSGPPIGFGNIIFNGDVNNIGLPGDQQTPERWINTDAGFEKNAALQLASNVRNFPLRFGFVRAATINNWDLSILKNTSIIEGKDLQFKAEALNAFNRVQFPAPNTTPTVAQFGQIQVSNGANYARRIQLTIKFLF